MRQHPSSLDQMHSAPKFRMQFPPKRLVVEIGALEWRGFPIATIIKTQGITCEISGWTHERLVTQPPPLTLRGNSHATHYSAGNRSALSARLLAHPHDRRSDDGKQEHVEEDRTDARGYERGNEASDGGRGRRGCADDEADAQVDHAVAQVGDGACDAGGDHDEERGAARDEISRTDGEFHAGHDDGSAAHADQAGEDAGAQAHQDHERARGRCQRHGSLTRGDVQILGDDDEDGEADEDTGQRGRREAAQEPHADLRARERADDEERGARPGDLAVQGVGARADGDGDDDGGERRGRGAALVHAQDGHEGGHDDEAASHSEEPGEESSAYACCNDEEDAAQGEWLGVSVGHASTVVLRHFLFGDGASPRAKWKSMPCSWAHGRAYTPRINERKCDAQRVDCVGTPAHRR